MTPEGPLNLTEISLTELTQNQRNRSRFIQGKTNTRTQMGQRVNARKSDVYPSFWPFLGQRKHSKWWHILPTWDGSPPGLICSSGQTRRLQERLSCPRIPFKREAAATKVPWATFTWKIENIQNLNNFQLVTGYFLLEFWSSISWIKISGKNESRFGMKSTRECWGTACDKKNWSIFNHEIWNSCCWFNPSTSQRGCYGGVPEDSPGSGDVRGQLL